MYRTVARAFALIRSTPAEGLGHAVSAGNQRSVYAEAIRAEVAGTSLDAEIDADLVARFSGRTVGDICATAGITTSALTLRRHLHRCGVLTPSQRPRSQTLSLTALARCELS